MSNPTPTIEELRKIVNRLNLEELEELQYTIERDYLIEYDELGEPWKEEENDATKKERLREATIEFLEEDFRDHDSMYAVPAIIAISKKSS